MCRKVHAGSQLPVLQKLRYVLTLALVSLNKCLVVCAQIVIYLIDGNVATMRCVLFCVVLLVEDGRGSPREW